MGGTGEVGPVSFCPLRGLSPASEGQRHPTCAPWMPLPWPGGRAWQVRFLPSGAWAAKGGCGPKTGLLLHALIRALTHSRGPHPVSFTPQPLPGTPHRVQDSTCECRGTQTSSPGSMSTPMRSLSGRCPSCPTQPDGSCADLPGGGQNRRPSHLHTKPSFSAQSENCNSGAALYCVRTFSTEPPGGDLTGRCRVGSGSGSGGEWYRVRARCRVRVMLGSS